MFAAKVYRQRREDLRRRMDAGLILFLGNSESPVNFADNCYPFRQDSCFLYYWGLDRPDLAALIDVDAGGEILFGDDLDSVAQVWTGPQTPLAEQAEAVAVNTVQPLAALAPKLEQARVAGRPIHVLPPYRDRHRLILARLFDLSPEAVEMQVSEPLLAIIIAQRSTKTAAEIAEIEAALAVTREMHIDAMAAVRPGCPEYKIAARLRGRCYAAGAAELAFAPILTSSGEVLHNPHHHQTLQNGQLVLNDSGAVSRRHYASDITRTFPVSGRFSQKQAEIYTIVLDAQLRAIELLRPGIAFREVHLAAMERIATGMVGLGLMRGDPVEIVAKGAHALFMPHGLGHMLGLDVHDMENLGEDRVGYSNAVPRSDQFGLSALRLGRELAEGFVVTVEPGLYFIPALIAQWRKEGRFSEHIRYDRLDAYVDFGGIRIEDDLHITATAARVLGPPIPKTISDVEAACAQ
ncbi:MAG: Xaa-Pro aminopeptidase [Desulfosarcinaceae bacterium]|nr:Xaa-Pro aminopeptidase [Desulfosarcinaceae bacterium]